MASRKRAGQGPRPAGRPAASPGGRRPNRRGSGLRVFVAIGLVIAAIFAAMLLARRDLGLVPAGAGDRPAPPGAGSGPAERKSESKPEPKPAQPDPAGAGTTSPFLDATALARFEGQAQALADYRRAAGFAAQDNGRGARPILERLAAGASDAPYREELLALQARAAVTDSPDRALALVKEFRAAFPKSRYADQVAVAEAKARLVQGRKAAGDAASGGATLPPVAATALDDAARLFGVVAESKGDPDAAAEGLLGRAQALSARGDSDGAVVAFERVAQRFPKDPRAPKALMAAAMDAWDRDDLDVARALMGRVVESWPASPEGKRARSELRALDVVGRAAPELKVAKWIGADAAPLSSLRGRTTLLVFWATWCPHCRKEMPEVVDLYRRYRARGLEVVAVTKHSKGQTDADVEGYARQNSLPFPVAVDLGGATSRDYGVSGIPAAAVVDRNGKVVWRNHPARLTDAELTRFLEG